MEQLPNEVLKYNILLRLPVRSVVRFMFTCKTYYSMISSDHQFAQAHWQRAGAGDQKVLIVDADHARSLNCNSLMITDINLPRTGGIETKEVRVIGSCRGLVCLLLSLETFVLWNPTTGEFRKLPVTLSSSNRRKMFYGLGYDSIRCDHKLVVVVNPVITKSNQGVEFNHCLVDYSLRSKSVTHKFRPNMIYFEPSLDDAVYCNHHLHWEGETIDPFCSDPDMTREDAILSYNLQEETFGYLPLPDIDYTFFQGITVIKDNLCGSFYSFDHPCFETWIMKEYGVSTSWTLLYRFDDRQHFVKDCYLWDGCKSLLGVSDDGYLIMDNRDDLSIIEPIDGAPSQYKQCKMVSNDCIGSRCWIYEDSLFSPNIGELNLDDVGNSRATLYQADKAGGRSASARKRKLDKQLCFKTALCNAWRSTGHCPLGNDCWFAHGMHEVRTKVCLNVLNGETCPFGELCKYRHDLTDFEKCYRENGCISNKRIHEESSLY